jgi:hypothetical protein
MLKTTGSGGLGELVIAAFTESTAMILADWSMAISRTSKVRSFNSTQTTLSLIILCRLRGDNEDYRCQREGCYVGIKSSRRSYCTIPKTKCERHEKNVDNHVIRAAKSYLPVLAYGF